MTTLLLARNRRYQLANAHARWIARTDKLPSLTLEQTLKDLGVIGEDDLAMEVGTNGTTTIEILLFSGETIELDAYGNTLRGTK